MATLTITESFKDEDEPDITLTLWADCGAMLRLQSGARDIIMAIDYPYQIRMLAGALTGIAEAIEAAPGDGRPHEKS